MSESNIISSRRRPLSTCGASTLAVAQGLYKWAIELNGPIGSMTRRLAKLGSVASPIASVVQCQWLAVLTFADDHILSIENKVEAHFPPSRHVFDTIDNVIIKVEDLPKKLEDSMNKFPAVLYKIPLVDWAVVHALKWLEFITTVLVIWSLHSAKEKEIRVDTNCKEQNKQLQGQSNNTIKFSSYKEALEKGFKNGKLDGKNDVDTKDYDGKDASNWNQETDNAQMGDVVATNEDPLLELFEYGWEAPKSMSRTTTPSTSRSHSRSNSRSNSYEFGWQPPNLMSKTTTPSISRSNSRSSRKGLNKGQLPIHARLDQLSSPPAEELSRQLSSIPCFYNERNRTQLKPSAPVSTIAQLKPSAPVSTLLKPSAPVSTILLSPHDLMDSLTGTLQSKVMLYMGDTALDFFLSAKAPTSVLNPSLSLHDPSLSLHADFRNCTSASTHPRAPMKILASSSSFNNLLICSTTFLFSPISPFPRTVKKFSYFSKTFESVSSCSPEQFSTPFPSASSATFSSNGTTFASLPESLLSTDLDCADSLSDKASLQ
ncbi:LOW QUALITY PROTEIN: hypothetical protein Cgig2_018170 [Carnegiea gigantea]|uniref:Uncharacterized protein n=1 Tax=Carnegiea gigantea TaxID=171969 RepID=A0A9Q1KZ98_9CARY|nr:LOW QUALITY PROTEIN: hypothetical protein Cgig2_018170 [Carnegiea gigantea]